MERRKKSALFLFIKDGKKAGLAAGTVKYYAQIHWYRQVLCANSFTSLAELSLHRAGKPALNYLVAEHRERIKATTDKVQ